MPNRAIKWGKNIPPNDDISELCCTCCGTPCHASRVDGRIIGGVCNPHCCTCYPASALEATISLHNCSPGGCNGILGTIRLTGPGSALATGGVAGDKDALCQRVGEVEGVHQGVEACKKQIGNDPMDPEGSPDLFEMWGGGAYLCCKDPVANAYGCPQEQYEGPDCQGQPFDMSVCCCGDDGQGDECLVHQFSCYDVQDKVNQSSDPSGPRDMYCSCPCYSVHLGSLPWGEPNGTRGVFCSELMDHSSSCYSTNQPGCPTDQPCAMDITYCQCTGGGDGGTEGWMIKAEMKLPYPLSCDCCPGIPGAPAGHPGAGGCVAGAIIRALIVPVM